jgi:hypothetical protein
MQLLLGSAVVSTAVFVVSTKISTRYEYSPNGESSRASDWLAGRQPERPRRSRSQLHDYGYEEFVKQQVKRFLVAGSVAVLTVLAVVFAVARAIHFRGDGETGARVWFYNQSTRRLYAAPRDLIPPDGKDDARVRATVIGFQGMGNNVDQLKIAYLEKYSPDLKALLERAEAARASKRPFVEKIPPPNSAYFQDNAMIKRPGEAAWHAIGSGEARQIMAEWREWHGPAGQVPIISVPSMR